MSFFQLAELIHWDWAVNRGVKFDNLRAIFLLLEVRLEEYLYQKSRQHSALAWRLLWYLARWLGSLFQWFFYNSNIPGSVSIGRGLRLPHPQNIVIAYNTDIGEFCTFYHDVSIVWNGFLPTTPGLPKVGSRVLIGCGAVIVGNVTVGSDVLIGAGTVVPKSIPDCSRVTSPPPLVSPRSPSENAAQAGSQQHLQDPYSIWR